MRRTPPSALITRAIMVIKKTCAHDMSHGPTCPWVIMHRESPGIRSWVVIIPIPAMIPPACSVNYCWPKYITSGVTWCVTHVYDVRVDIIYINILYIISRVVRRYLLDLIRNRGSNDPGSFRSLRGKPHGIVTNKVDLFIK